jgi:hypothetical protein
MEDRRTLRWRRMTSRSRRGRRRMMRRRVRAG